MVDLAPTPDFSGWRSKRRDTEGLKVPLKATVIALDPGGTTGWSVMRVHPESLSDPEVSILNNIQYWTHGQTDCGSTKGNLGKEEHRGISTTGEAAGVAELVGLVRHWPEACVVIEDFIVRQYNMSRDFLSPVRITAALSQWLWQQKRGYFVQQPAYAKTTVTDERLKDWGLYRSEGGLNHARDADRHAITFLRKCKADNEFRRKAFPHLYAKGAPYFRETDMEARRRVRAEAKASKA